MISRSEVINYSILNKFQYSSKNANPNFCAAINTNQTPENQTNAALNPTKENHHSRKKHKDELLNSTPIYLSSYANELGTALLPLPGIGQKLFVMSWVPVLMYLGADIHSKYQEIRENKDNKTNSQSKANAIELVVFEEITYSVLSSAAAIMGQKIVSRAYGMASKDKMDIRAKEDIITELKRDLNQRKMRAYRKTIDDLLLNNKDKTIDEIKNHEKIKNLKNDLTESIFDEIKLESEHLINHKKNSNILKRIWNKITDSNMDCEYVSRIQDKNIEKRVKPYLSVQVDELIDKRIEIQSALTPEGLLSANAKNLDKNLVKKLTTMVNKIKKNRDIIDKSAFIIQEYSMNKLNKSAYKLSLIKIAGGLAALFASTIPIDKFMTAVFTPKGVEFDIDKVSKNMSNFSS